MSGTQYEMRNAKITGTILGTVICLTYLGLGIAIFLFYIPYTLPERIRLVLPWAFLGSIPLMIGLGRYVYGRKESLKREILAGFCGYLLWIAVLFSGYVEPLNSVVFGYSVELAAILLEWRFLK